MNLSGRERVEYFVQKYVHYSVLHQTCSDRLRALGRSHFADIYNETREEWLGDPSNPLFELPLHEKQKREIHLAQCDRICETEPKTVRECVCSAAQRRHKETHRFSQAIAGSLLHAGPVSGSSRVESSVTSTKAR